MVLYRIIKWFNAKTVPGQKEAVLPSIVDSKDKDAPKPGHHLLSVFLVKVDQHFGIRGAAEDVTLAFQTRPQILVIVDFSVEDNVEPAILVGHGLLAGN